VKRVTEPMARLGVSIRTGGTVLALLALMPLGGCLVSAVAPPRVEVANTEPVLPVPMPVSGPETGAIFQSSQYRPLFEDHRARLVGDTLTVTIVEKVTATQSSRSTVDKTGTLTGAVTALPGISPNAFRRATADATTSPGPSPCW